MTKQEIVIQLKVVSQNQRIQMLLDKLPAITNEEREELKPFFQLSDSIDALSDADRKEIRIEAERQGVKVLPRNLYFNYETQTWID